MNVYFEGHQATPKAKRVAYRLKDRSEYRIPFLRAGVLKTYLRYFMHSNRKIKTLHQR